MRTSDNHAAAILDMFRGIELPKASRSRIRDQLARYIDHDILVQRENPDGEAVARAESPPAFDFTDGPPPSLSDMSVLSEALERLRRRDREAIASAALAQSLRDLAQRIDDGEL